MSAFNGSGTFVISGVGLPFVTGTTISSTVANQLNTDLATGLSNCVTKDGQTTPTANIPMGGFKLTGLGAATTGGDALSYAASSTWVPVDASGAGLSLTVIQAKYLKIGSMVIASCAIGYPATADVSPAGIGGFPFAFNSYDNALVLTNTTQANGILFTPVQTTLAGGFCDLRNIANTIKNNTLSSTSLSFTIIYFI